MRRLEINADLVLQFLVQFIKEHTETPGFSRVVLGMSGGLDSTVAAYLAVKALGKNGCVGAFLPHKVNDPSSLKDAAEVATTLGIRIRRVDITSLVEPFEKAFPDMDQIQLGNVMARCRMIALYQISAEEKALVMGTSNKSERLLGYGTLYGDLACAFNPLGDLYKTQVRALAEALGVPEKIRRKAPSAELWTGQSDEGELGLTYAEADLFLVRWVDDNRSRDELVAEGFNPDFTDRIMRWVASQQFKRALPPIPNLSKHTVGADFHHPRDGMK